MEEMLLQVKEVAYEKDNYFNSFCFSFTLDEAL